MRFEAELDIADALDLDHALAQGAATLKALGSEASLDVRRATALGELARTQTALDLASPIGGRATRDDGAVPGPHLPAAREVVIHAHFAATTDGTATVFGSTGRMEEGQRLVLLDQVQGWCADSRTKVSIKPVVDLNAELGAPGYEVPEWLREQIALRDGACVFSVVHPAGPQGRCRPRHRVRP
jgi:hypothetical protein